MLHDILVQHYAGRAYVSCLRKVLEEHALAASTQLTIHKRSRSSGTLLVLPHETVYHIGSVSGVHRCILSHILPHTSHGTVC